VGPYLFLYGHDGVVSWSAPGKPQDFLNIGSGNSRPVSDKIVRGMPVRGSAAPAIILWSLSSVILGQFVGGDTIWNFTTATTSGSILSSNGVVEHNGIYYWATTSGFSQFNGVVRDMPNDDNRQWFLDNVNLAQRQKVFAYKVPRWNEIWWCFPFGNATECNWAIIYNWLENAWYDTPLPNSGRSAAYYEFIFAHPIMSGVIVNSDTGGYSMWQHEIGYDEVSGAISSPKAIKSRFQTNEFNYVAPSQLGAQGINRSMSYSIMEPDFEQVGDLAWSTETRANARANIIASDPIFFSDAPLDNADQVLKIKLTGRLTSFIIESNCVGGNYITGSPLIHFQPGDARIED
jgi:hypothetical protein